MFRSVFGCWIRISASAWHDSPISYALLSGLSLSAAQFGSGNGGALREEAEVGNRSVGCGVRAVAQALGHDAEELERARVMTRLTSHELSGGSTTYNSADQPRSRRQMALRDIPDLLPGRSETIELWPLSQGEIGRAADGFVDAVFEHGATLAVAESPLRRGDYLERALRGGYPEAVRRTDLGRRARFFESYVSDLISRDVRQVSEIERPADMRRLLNLVAASMATLAVPAAFANHLRLPASTVKRYLDLLELLYVVRRIPAWSTNLTTRAVATPKLMVVDSGLAGHLAGMTAKRARHPTAPVGPIMENFVLGELARQLSWAHEPVHLYHYRDRDGNDVDAVLERASGEVVAVEVKAAETVRSEDFRGIQHLRRRLGDQLLAGFVLYAGRQALPFGERLCALPISALWTTVLSGT